MPAEDADLSQLGAWPTHAGEFPLWPENRAVFDLFTRCATQWDHAGMDGIKFGLPQERVEMIATRLKFKWSADAFTDLQTLESAALHAWAQQRAHDALTKA